MTKNQRPSPLDPTEIITSIFTARRDLLHGIKLVVAGSGFTVEEADLLVSLYGARKLDWDDLDHDPDGFVPFSQLERYLVHSASLLSRRIHKLATAKPALVEVAQADPKAGHHFNAKRVRITEKGVRDIEPVWRRFEQMSATLLKGISPALLESHHTVNRLISAEISRRRDGMKELFPKTP